MNQEINTPNKQRYRVLSKTRLFITLTLLMTYSFTLQAQVTIGSAEIPTYGALLELKTQQAGTVANVGDEENVTSTAGGLLLPRVKLTNFISLNSVVQDGNDLTLEEKLKLAGLMVYNINAVASTLYLGVYVWNGSAWAYLVDSKVSSPMTVGAQPKAFSFYETGLETPDALVFEVNPPKAADDTEGTVSYQWYQIVGSNLHARVGQLISGATYSSYAPTVAFKTTDGSKSTRYAQNNGMYRFYCVAKGSDASTVTSNIVEVAVGCGAKNNLGEWISFMCFNLGATNGITIQGQKEYSIGTFVNSGDGEHTYVADEENVWGDLFQWGRIADGHEDRQSAIQAHGDGTDLAANIGSGYYCFRSGAKVSGDPYPYSQIKETAINWYGKFILSNSAANNYNWYPASISTSIDQLWRSGRFVVNDACAKYKADGTYVPAWHTDLATNGENTNPACKDSGTSWRTPQQEEWGAIYKSGAISGSPAAASANTWTWYNGTASNYSRGYEIKPDGYTTTLFLPASGVRNGVNNDVLYSQGAFGSYWSSSNIIGGINAYSMVIGDRSVIPANSQYRAYGLTLRCIKSE